MLVWQQGRQHIQDIRKMMLEHSQQFIHKEGIANYLRTEDCRNSLVSTIRRDFDSSFIIILL